MNARAPLPQPVVMVDDIVTAVCAAYEIERLDILSERRQAHFVAARRAVALLASRLTVKGTRAIGRAINRDHSTVMGLCRGGERQFQLDADYRAEIQALEIAALGVALARVQGVMQRGQPDIDPYRVARAIVADGLIKACRVSLDEIMAMSAELDSIAKRRNARAARPDATDEAGEDAASEDNDESVNDENA